MEAARTPGVCSQLLHPCSLRGKGTQVGPPHCRWRHAENKCRAEPARYGKKDSTGVQFLATDLRGVWQWPDGYAILTTICKVKIDQSAGMAKLADAADLKSAGPKGLWGFDSPSRHQPKSLYLRGSAHLVRLRSFGRRLPVVEKALLRSRYQHCLGL